MKKNISRNENIRLLNQKGLSKEAISKIYNISNQRIGQILRKYKGLRDENIRKFIHKRDDQTCQICHKELLRKEIQIHHIDTDSHNNIISNLICLCIKCHNNIHTEITEKYRRNNKTKSQIKFEKDKKKKSDKLHAELKILNKRGKIEEVIKLATFIKDNNI